MNLRLRPVLESDEDVVRAAEAAMVADDFIFALGLEGQSFAEWLAQLHREDIGDVPAHRVRHNFLLAEVDGDVVGRTSVRHVLNDHLRNYGGHIGYGVLAEYRRRGYAHEILRQSLIIARAHGVDRALITCDDDNLASIATIEGAGGVLDADFPIAEGEGAPKRRYWVD